jgi:pimeloyl-ACP methyl ester carboxylesterase
LIILLAGDSQAGSTDPTPDSLASLIFQYLDANDSEEAERLLPILLSRPDVSIETAIRIVQTERPYTSQPIGMLPDEQITIRGRPYPLALSVPLTYQPSKGYGLVVCLHGAGFTGEAYLERWQARLGEDYILACPTYPAGAWFTRRAEELVLAAVQQVRRRYHIDPDRIFLTGMSNGGIGAWLIGMHDAPMFGGIAPMASGLDDVLLPFLANLSNTGIYIIHGTKDQVMPVELSRALSRELTALGIPHVYREHQREHPIAGGHYFPREELPDLVAWFSRQRREPLPTKITVVREASRFQSFNWVRIESTDPIAAFSDDLIDKRD